MRVSLVTTATAYPATESAASLVRFFLRRGDQMHVYAGGGPDSLPQLSHDTGIASVTFPAAAGELSARAEFRSSELFVFHAGAVDPVLHALYALDRGVVVLWLQPENTCDDEQLRQNEVIRLASASDIVVVDDEQQRQILLESGAVETERVWIVPPAVTLSQFSPGPPELTVLREFNLFGKRILLHLASADAGDVPQSVLTLFEEVHSRVPDAALVVAATGEGTLALPSGMANQSSVHILPRVADLSVTYRLADLLLTNSCTSAGRQHALEAMACGTPVLLGDRSGEYSVSDACNLLSDDTVYGAQVQLGLGFAAQHSRESFVEAWARLVADACGWLPVRNATPVSSGQSEASFIPVSPSNAGSAAPPSELLGVDIEQLKSMAAVTLPTYEVRSPTPFFGPFIAWVRRNLTSHLRKPYLDPTLDRQEAFNFRAANTLEQLAAQIAHYRQERIEAESGTRQPTDPQLIELIQQLAAIIDDMVVDDATRDRSDEARRLLGKLREMLSGSTSGDRAE